MFAKTGAKHQHVCIVENKTYRTEHKEQNMNNATENMYMSINTFARF